MAIRFDSDLNARMRKDVRNFNKKILRAERRGFRNLPNTVKVSELKSRYKTRGELVRELDRLKNFNRGDILTRVENQGGAKAVKWQLDFIRANAKNARQHFEREYERISKRTLKYPGERMYLDTISAKINLLDENITYMSQEQFRSALSAVTEYYNEPAYRESQYRGFLNEVEWVMDRTGISEERKNEFFKKFGKLTATQFLYAYDNNDIIKRIYELYHKDEDGEAHLTDSDENAEDLVDELMDEADDIVADAKRNAD